MSESRSTVFWVVVGLAFVWNLMGVAAFFAEMSITPEMIAAMSQDEQDLRAVTPAWVNIAFGVAVIAGTLGCLLMLLKKPVAHYVLWLSLIGVLAQMSYVFLVSKAFEIYGPGQAIMPGLVILVAVLLVWYSKRFQNTA
jgi:hypothetical protein